MLRHRALLLLGAIAIIACGGPPKPPAKPVKKGAVAPEKTTPKKKPAPAEIAKEAPDAIPAGCKAVHAEIVKAYAPYLAAYSNIGLELSPNNKQILFMSSRGGGSLQLYLGDARRTKDKPLHLAPSKERVSGARFTPDGKHVLFVRDKDNNEKYQLYRVRTDGSAVIDLSRHPERFYALPEVSSDSKTVYGFRGVHKSPIYELYSMPIVGGTQRVIFKGKGFHYLADLSADNKLALVVNLTSLSASRMLVLDLATGKTRQLAPSAGVEAHATHGSFAPDGKHVYLTTNEGTERSHLRKVLLDSGKEVARYVDAKAEVAAVLAKKRTIVVQLNAGSHRSIKLLDKQLRARPKVRMQLGSASLGMLSKDGKKLVVTFSNMSTVRDVFVLDTRRGRTKPLRQDKRPGLSKLVKVSAKVVHIPTFDELKVPINVYLPKKRKRNIKLPVLVSVHGGPAASSTVSWNPFIAFWIARGYAVVQPNVRGSTGFGKAYEQADNLKKRMDAVKDLAAVNTWIRKQPWADANKLAVFGGSYGGYMVYMAMGHQSDRWAAGVGAVGVVNLRTFLATTTGAIRHAFRKEFGVLDKDGAFLDSVSPIHAVARFKKPLLVYQGATDPRVPRSEQDQLVRALRKRGVPVEYMVADDEGHSLSHKHTKLEFIGRMMRFLDQHLGHGKLPPSCAKNPAPGAVVSEKMAEKKAKPAK
ncbi:MAG: S9 family peptidase [Deltaproteobacteria bacterium]|nr:S9 family peptidase [Deltaproteobacteria bacterium]